jgi:hypothetical protein
MQLNYATVPGQSYIVDLLFAEIWSGAFARGRRVFDVALDGKLVLDDLDVFARVGANTALVQSFEIVGDGMLNVDLQRGVQNPILSGLRIRPAGKINSPPALSPIDNQQTSEDQTLSNIAITVTDPENQPVSLSVTSSDAVLLPPSGLQLSGSGTARSLNIVPAANRSGSATVTVTASDGQASVSRSFNVVVDPVNDAPLAAADNAVTPRDVPVTITVLANDSDIDNAINPASVQITVPPASGNAAANANGTVTFTPAAGFSGNASFSYTVRDAAGLTSNAATVVVNVQNNLPPVISSIADLELNAGTASPAISIQVTDPDGDPLNVTATAADSSIVRSVVISGSGSNRQLVVTAGNTVGETTVTVTAQDGKNTPVTRTFRVLVFALIDAGTPTPAPGTLSDAGFQNGVGRNFAATGPVKPVAGVSEQLFRTILWDDVGGSELGFDIRAKAGERFAVDLYFAEVWSGAFGARRRVFDVELDGRKVLDDFDVFREAGGGNIGIVRRFELESDGIIDLDLLHGIQNPAIAGIRVTPLRQQK